VKDLFPGYQLRKHSLVYSIQNLFELLIKNKLFEEHFGMYPILNAYTCVGTKKSRALIL
jgi:hypothetical protein